MKTENSFYPTEEYVPPPGNPPFYFDAEGNFKVNMVRYATETLSKESVPPISMMATDYIQCVDAEGIDDDEPVAQFLDYRFRIAVYQEQGVLDTPWKECSCGVLLEFRWDAWKISDGFFARPFSGFTGVVPPVFFSPVDDSDEETFTLMQVEAVEPVEDSSDQVLVSVNGKKYRRIPYLGAGRTRRYGIERLDA